MVRESLNEDKNASNKILNLRKVIREEIQSLSEINRVVMINKTRFKKNQDVQLSTGEKGIIVRFAGADVWTVSPGEMVKGDTWYDKVGDKTPIAYKYDKIKKI